MKKLVFTLIAILCLVSCNDAPLAPIDNFKGAKIVEKCRDFHKRGQLTLRYKPPNGQLKDTTISVVGYDYEKAFLGDTIQ